MGLVQAGESPSSPSSERERITDFPGSGHEWPSCLGSGGVSVEPLDTIGEAGAARRSAWARAAGEPSCEAVEVNGRGGGHALRACHCQPAAVGPVQAQRAHALRDRGLDALPLGVEPLARLACQPPPGGRDRLVLGTRVQRQPAARALRASRARDGQGRPSAGLKAALTQGRASCLRRCLPHPADGRVNDKNLRKEFSAPASATSSGRHGGSRRRLRSSAT